MVRKREDNKKKQTHRVQTDTQKKNAEKRKAQRSARRYIEKEVSKQKHAEERRLKRLQRTSKQKQLQNKKEWVSKRIKMSAKTQKQKEHYNKELAGKKKHYRAERAITLKEVQRTSDATRKKKTRMQVGHTRRERLQKFRRDVKYGAIFPCSSCEQTKFENGVSVIDDNIRNIIETACNGKMDNILKDIFEDKLDNPKFSVYIDFKTNRYLCHTCKDYLTKGKIPPMSATNGLKVTPLRKEFQLSELSNNLISKKILFQKIFRLPKSLMPAVKDKLINIPIGDNGNLVEIYVLFIKICLNLSLA